MIEEDPIIEIRSGNIKVHPCAFHIQLCLLLEQYRNINRNINGTYDCEVKHQCV